LEAKPHSSSNLGTFALSCCPDPWGHNLPGPLLGDPFACMYVCIPLPPPPSPPNTCTCTCVGTGIQLVAVTDTNICIYIYIMLECNIEMQHLKMQQIKAQDIVWYKHDICIYIYISLLHIYIYICSYSREEG